LHSDREKSLRTTQGKQSALTVQERGKRGDREEEFLSAALQLFAERNFASVTIKDIAQSIGVNTALIYYYFENKTDLLRAAIDLIVARSFENIKALENSNADPESMISAWLDNHVRKFAEIHRFVKIALDFKGAHEGDPAIEATIARFYAEERKMLARVFRQGVERGIFTPVEPDRMAQFISTYLDGCMVRSVILGDFNLKVAVEDLRRMIFHQLGCEPASQTRRTRKTKRS
jgi:TetR/AcrR family transcriptional regulator, upper aerobic nicotinate degradation pathway regulator